MKTTPLLLSLSLLLFCPLVSATSMPMGDVYLCQNAPQTPVPAAEYRGHLLPTMQDYLYCLQREAQGRSAPGVRTFRHAAFDIARRFPAEVNDLVERADGSWATPLSMAVQAQDGELVDLLLKLGALPFSPNAAFPLHELAPLPGVAPRAEVAQLLHEAQKRYNPLQIILSSRQHGSGQANSAHAQLSPTLSQLADTYENTYLCEPGEAEKAWLLYDAFRMLGSPQGTLLRLQPMARSVIQPGENTDKGGGLYGSIITTARVVDALTGILPTCEFITWEVPHEGPIRNAETLTHVTEEAEPAFFVLSPHMLEKATQEEGHLKLGMLDPFSIRNGEKWQAAFDRVLADYPELLETIPATAEELAAARQLMEESPVLARANIFRYSAEADETAGQVHVCCYARLRAPLKGALIKGALRDWDNICYKRSFPLTEEWRQRLAGKRRASVNIPVILAMAPTEETQEGDSHVSREARQPMKVLQAFDAVNDAALFRAINQAAFRPWSATEE